MDTFPTDGRVVEVCDEAGSVAEAFWDDGFCVGVGKPDAVRTAINWRNLEKAAPPKKRG